MTNSIIAIKGNHLVKLESVFESFNYIDNNNDKRFDSWEKTATYLFDNYSEFSNKGIAIRGIWFNNGWTIICDPELVDSTDDKAIEILSRKLNTEVLTFLIQTTSGSFGFAKYNKTKQRRFFAIEGQITENFGAPLMEELGLNINDKVFGEDILLLAIKLGIDLEVKNTKTTFIVKELGYNEEMKKQLEQFAQKSSEKKANNQKPWWKFWQ